MAALGKFRGVATATVGLHEVTRSDEHGWLRARVRGQVKFVFYAYNDSLIDCEILRHPSNLMLDRATGKVLHIDFGDCFESTMHRDKFPERVPFRLTRMLVNAMEVSGIEGNFRLTCEKVMAILRENKDSVIATLEAFVYDPLVSWRLQDNEKSRRFQPSESLKSGLDPTAFQDEVSTPIAGLEREPPPDINRNRMQNTTSGGAAPYQRARLNSRLRPLPPVLETIDDPEHSELPTAHRKAEDHEEQLGVDVDQQPLDKEETPPDYLNLHMEMQHLSTSVTRLTDLAHPLNHRSSRSHDERSFASHRRRGLTYGGDGESEDAVPDKAVEVIRRINDKLTGLDFVHRPRGAKPVAAIALDVPQQVDKLILQATSNENLCLSFFGWCPFW